MLKTNSILTEIFLGSPSCVHTACWTKSASSKSSSTITCVVAHSTRLLRTP